MGLFDALPAATQILGSGLSAYGNIKAADASKVAGENQNNLDAFQAAQLLQNANQAFAAGERGREEQIRQGQLVQSRILAIAAAGGGALDPTVVNLMGRAAGDAVYRGNVALYEGEEQARQMRLAAAAKGVEGIAAMQSAKAKATGYDIGALTSIAKGATTLYTNYGMSYNRPISAAGDSSTNAGTSDLQ